MSPRAGSWPLADRGLNVDYRTVWDFVHAESSVTKKTLIATEQDRPDFARRRARCNKYWKQIGPSRLGFIDETWITTDIAPLRRSAPRGQRIIARCRGAAGRP
jgi:hypothetical protein